MQRHFLRLVPVATILIPFIWCFGSALLTPGSFAHRDAARFYHPLFEWTIEEWEGGRVPLWNPQENCGTSVVGDATSSVWYPGKLVFLLPFDFIFNYKFYVLLHILSAAATSFLLARHWKATSQAASLCALSYAFGGYVVFQHTNVVFLVGASWLPASVLAIDCMIRRRRVVWSLVLGITLALMTLGGDPQAAYHAGLLATLYAILVWVNRLRRVRRRTAHNRNRAPIEAAPKPLWQRVARHRLALLAMAASSGWGLAAIQILPSIQQNARSERATLFDTPRNVYQILPLLSRPDPGPGQDQTLESRVGRGLFGSPLAETHHRNIYLYSIAPWRLVELAFPNASGKPFPTNRRLPLVNEMSDAWVPSLYLGILPLLLALSVWRIRSRSIRTQWLSWSVALAIVGSFGWYGPGWVLQALRSDEGVIGEPVGGLYWMMVTWLPSYDQFRYPAKLFLVASLGLSLLAARGWDRMCVDPKRVVVLLRWLGGIAAIGLLASILGRSTLTSWLNETPPDEMFGPLSANGAATVLHLSLLHTTLVCGICWWFSRRLLTKHDTVATVALLLLTAAELAVAQGWMISLAPDDLWHSPAWADREIKAHVADSEELFRVHRSRGFRFRPPEWTAAGSSTRDVDALRWHRDTLSPRTHLDGDMSLFVGGVSINPDDLMAVVGIAHGYGPAREDDVSHLHPDVLNAFGVRYIVQADRADVERFRVQLGYEKIAMLPNQNAAIWFDPNHFPRSWIVHDVEWLPKNESNEPSYTGVTTAHVFFPEGRPRDLRVQAAVETEHPPDPASLRPLGAPPPVESCRVVNYEPQRVEIEAELNQPGLVVLSDYYDPDWRAEVIAKSTGAVVPNQVLRTNRIMRGLYLPPGKFKILYRYEPRAFWRGAGISVVCWSCCAVWLITRLSLLIWRRQSEP
jgi:hypothetical protein